ncbi:PRC-barrel domain-containing protein [Roseibium sediminicola]|uniref:PRC-barrel domain-containing protein n=1 Tax=Roseibium sediminicola TaxID=2933272 RepID=A0ABT0H076_9HYPH|nr:PRC-barrel domain-containing protein [Roseibium sp. CAU 1639]MCK7615095.1 PRC-barrel domain-containing protein [Roseibium sp. CAU 1639]
MLRHFLTTTAIVAMVSSTAIAGNTAATGTATQAETGASDGVYEFEFHTLAPSATTGFLASNMIGKAVMTGEADDAEEIGDINDVIIGRDGQVRAVIVGVGGFLGIGEKEVAVDMNRLTFVTESDDQFTIVSDASRAELEQAASFERPDYIPDWMSTETVREEMNEISKRAEETYETVQTEAVDPVKKRIEDTVASDWTAEKTEVNTRTISTEALIDAAVYTGEGVDIGEISQILLGKEGKAQAVVIYVGGFLGFGEKPVAVSYDSLRIYETTNGALLVTAPFSKEQLEEAAPFEPAAYKESPESLTLKG